MDASQALSRAVRELLFFAGQTEVRSGQVWPGRKAVRAFLEDCTAERQRKNAAVNQATNKAGGKTGGKKNGGRDGLKAGKEKERKT